MSEQYRKCVKCCVTAAQDPSLSFHRFPYIGKERPETLLRSRIWAEFSFPTKDCTDINFLRNLHTSHKMLCSRHFSADSYMSTNRLNKFSIPIGTETILQKVRNEAGSSDQVSPKPGTSNALQNEENVGENNILIFTVPTDLPLSAGTVELQQTSGECSTAMKSKSKSKHSHKAHKNCILKSLGIQKVQELSSREQKLYKILRQSLQRVCVLKQKWKQQKKLKKIDKLASNDDIRKLFDCKLSDSLVLLLQSQLKNCSRKPKGRRYNLQQQILFLTLYKKSPALYRLLRRIFSLPCQSTIKKLLNKVPLKPGINSQMFTGLANMVESNEEEENICTLMFDEMGIKRNLAYNKKIDIVEGYQDHGRHGRSHNIANKALVFMLSGVRKKWKQPVAYYLSSSYTTADRLVILIKEVLEECIKVGLNIVATVCDLSPVNIRALEILGSTKETPVFVFAQQEIVTILDPPHLLKCYRNLFIKHDVLCATDVQCSSKPIDGTAKWSHIRTFYNIDKMNPNFVYAPALTDIHIFPNNKQKMRVKLAAQIFSHSVAVGILAKTSSNELPAEAVATANFLYKMDDLFDALNADSKYLRHGKKYSTNMTTKSPHLEYFKKMKKFIGNMRFIGSNTNPPSQEGWIRTMNAIEKLWHNLNRLGIKSLSTRRLNQDVLENCFGCIRYSCGSNYNPTVSQFVAGIKTAVISNLKHSGRRRNCEDDTLVLANNLQDFLISGNNETDSDDTLDTGECDPEHNIELIAAEAVKNIDQAVSEIQACAYVCGFIIRKQNITCDNCKKNFLSTDHNATHIFTEFKEYNIENASLNYASEKFIECVEICASLIKKELIINSHRPHIYKHLKAILHDTVDFRFLLKCDLHYRHNIDFIKKSVTFICLKRYLILKNREFK